VCFSKVGKHAPFCFEGQSARDPLKVNKLARHRRQLILTACGCRSVVPGEGDRPEHGDVHGENEVVPDPAGHEEEAKVASDILTPIFFVKCLTKCKGIL
jgi:hypothetical protein